MPFTSLGLPPALAQALNARGLNAPMPVQEAAIPVLMAGKSAMLVSRTGSGKTLAYLLPILAGIDPGSTHLQALILAPTHELAMQIHRVAADLSREAGLGVRVQALIGGAAVSRQIEGLKKKPHLAVGSAGRVTHLMEQGKLKLRDTIWLILDEADRLLVEEGLEHVRTITTALGPETRFVFVSATEGPATTRVARGLAPQLEFVRTQDGISPAIRHCYLVCEERDKIDWLRKVLRGLTPRRALVFVHRGASAERMAERLDYHQLAVADLHGARDKFDRQAALEGFRKGKANVLIASDIAARGLDISDVELVANVDVPSQSRDYLHRAGRTGRAGAPGLVLSFMTPDETRLARRYAEELDIAMEPVSLVRGALVPADEGRTQTLRPSGRPAGPGRDRKAGGRTGTEGKSAPTEPAAKARRTKGPGPGETAQTPRPAEHGTKPDGSGRPADSRPKGGKKPVGQGRTSAPEGSAPAPSPARRGGQSGPEGKAPGSRRPDKTGGAGRKPPSGPARKTSK